MAIQAFDSSNSRPAKWYADNTPDPPSQLQLTVAPLTAHGPSKSGTTLHAIRNKPPRWPHHPRHIPSNIVTSLLEYPSTARGWSIIITLATLISKVQDFTELTIQNSKFALWVGYGLERWREEYGLEEDCMFQRTVDTVVASRMEELNRARGTDYRSPRFKVPHSVVHLRHPSEPHTLSPLVDIRQSLSLPADQSIPATFGFLQHATSRSASSRLDYRQRRARLLRCRQRNRMELQREYADFIGISVVAEKATPNSAMQSMDHARGPKLESKFTPFQLSLLSSMSTIATSSFVLHLQPFDLVLQPHHFEKRRKRNRQPCLLPMVRQPRHFQKRRKRNRQPHLLPMVLYTYRFLKRKKRNRLEYCTILPEHSQVRFNIERSRKRPH